MDTKCTTADVEELFETSNRQIREESTAFHRYLMGEIDWPKNHMHNTEIYQAAWDICVNGREPVTKEEKLIKQNFFRRWIFAFLH